MFKEAINPQNKKKVKSSISKLST